MPKIAITHQVLDENKVVITVDAKLHLRQKSLDSLVTAVLKYLKKHSLDTDGKLYLIIDFTREENGDLTDISSIVTSIKSNTNFRLYLRSFAGMYVIFSNQSKHSPEVHAYSLLSKLINILGFARPHLELVSSKEEAFKKLKKR